MLETNEYIRLANRNARDGERMKSDLVRRQDVLDIVYLDPGISETNAKMIKELPSAEPENGEWSEITIPWSPDYLIYKCSKCGGIEVFRSRFCPNCGAEMRGAGYESFYE